MSVYSEDEALKEFEVWYEKCILNGIEPEKIVEKMGEMKLLINNEQIETYEKATGNG